MNKYRITYFPQFQGYSVWQQVEGKAPGIYTCINGYDTENWFHSKEAASDWLEKYKRKIKTTHNYEEKKIK